MRREDHLYKTTGYKTAGVDTEAAQSGLERIVASIRQTWPAPDAIGAVKLDIGYFANVLDIGGIGLAICSDRLGAKTIIAQRTGRYDTSGSDCGAVDVK